MKKLVLTLAFIATTITFSIAQNPPHPNSGGGPGSGNTPVGGGAPLGGGLIIMTIMAIGYGSKKALQFNQVNNLKN